MSVHEETHEKCGVTYDVVVDEEDGGYLGKWYCSCGEHGGSSAGCANIKAAVLAAKINFDGHHKMNHG